MIAIELAHLYLFSDVKGHGEKAGVSSRLPLFKDWSFLFSEGEI